MNAKHNLTSNFVMHSAFWESRQSNDGKAVQIISGSNVETTVHEPATSRCLLAAKLQWVDTNYLS